jgi:mRNA-degrading endonuclease RelE of RelBE toxin-antitoxin system
MMFEIKFTEGALDDLQVFTKDEQRRIVKALELELTLRPALESLDRRRLNPNGLAEWEIRVGEARVFYDVDIQNATVKIEAVGKKLSI